MRPVIPMIAVALLAISVAAQAASPVHVRHPAHAPAKAAPASGSPKAIGRFDAWTAATHLEAGQTVCYAFTRVASSSPPVSGRGDVVLTVTERPGAARDAVAITVGFAYPPNARVGFQIDADSFPVYTAQRSAFARDGRAVVRAMQRGSTATVRSPMRRGQVTDTFSLRGFSAAYGAIVKACPG